MFVWCVDRGGATTTASTSLTISSLALPASVTAISFIQELGPGSAMSSKARRCDLPSLPLLASYSAGLCLHQAAVGERRGVVGRDVRPGEINFRTRRIDNAPQLPRPRPCNIQNRGLVPIRACCQVPKRRDAAHMAVQAVQDGLV